MNFAILIPARSNSTRLRQKHLRIVNGKSILNHLVLRLLNSGVINSKKKIILCTTENKIDNELIFHAKKIGINFTTGRENDMIGRFYNTALKNNLDYIIRVDGDDVYTDPNLLDRGFKKILSFKKKVDYLEFKKIYLGLAPKFFTNKAIIKINKCIIKDNYSTGFGYYFSKTDLLKKFFINYNSEKKKKLIYFSLDFSSDLNIFQEVLDYYGNKFYNLSSENLINFFENHKKIQNIFKKNSQNRSNYYSKMSKILLKFRNKRGEVINIKC